MEILLAGRVRSGDLNALSGQGVWLTGIQDVQFHEEIDRFFYTNLKILSFCKLCL